MSQLYSVIVNELSDATVVLELEIVHPDAGLHMNDEYTKSFALRLLYDTAYELNMESDNPLESRGTCALGKAFSYDDSGGESWMSEHVDEYISSAVVTAPAGLPEMPPVGTKAICTITVTNPKWIEHLSVGQKWDSAAY